MLNISTITRIEKNKTKTMNSKEIKASVIYLKLKSNINWNENNDPQNVDTRNINPEIIDHIIQGNEEYLIWADGSEITKDDILSYFDLVKYGNGNVSLSHRQDDFYIHDIIF
jgi:hypothetical protein